MSKNPQKTDFIDLDDKEFKNKKINFKYFFIVVLIALTIALVTFFGKDLIKNIYFKGINEDRTVVGCNDDQSLYIFINNDMIDLGKTEEAIASKLKELGLSYKRISGVYGIFKHNCLCFVLPSWNNIKC